MALNVKPAKLKGYGNYGKINAHLASGAPIPAVAKWVASYGLHADYMPGGGENIVRADVGQQWTGPQGLNATNLAFRSNTYSRITGKVSYEMPSQHNLKIWSEATVYPGSTYDEFGFVIANRRYVTSLAPVRFSVGVSREF